MSNPTSGPLIGLPLLSGPAPDHPDVSDGNCRKCKKSLNVLFSRGRKCNHCGYMYCSSCTDFGALMPRPVSRTESPFHSVMGHDVVQVCGFCIRYLNITAKSRDQLKSMPLSQLKEYAHAYNIHVDDVVEKNDFVDRLLFARTSGCLKPQHEEYYRRNKVPGMSEPRSRGFFSRATGGGTGSSSQQQQQGQNRPSYQPRARTTSHPSSFPRPDLEQGPPEPRHTETTRPPPPPPPPRRQSQPSSPSPPPPQNQYGSQRPQQGTPPRPAQRPPPTSPRRQRSSSLPRAAPSPRATSPAPLQAPTLEQLLDMPNERLSGLSISALKSVLFNNHVPPGAALEKSDLVEKVRQLVDQERREREEARRRAQEEEETQEIARIAEQLDREEREQELARARAAGATGGHGEPRDAFEHDTTEESEDTTSRDSPPSPPPDEAKPQPSFSKPTMSHLERTGLCVICQDEEANIAIVDCGHLALCRTCSDLVWNTSKECPLCRTRIITQARFLRIFKS